MITAIPTNITLHNCFIMQLDIHRKKLRAIKTQFTFIILKGVLGTSIQYASFSKYILLVKYLENTNMLFEKNK